MHVSLPVFYEIEYRARKSARYSRIERLAHLDAELPEIALSEMEVLATWKTRNVYNHSFARQTLTCARWNGDLYVPLTQWSGLPGQHFVPSSVFTDLEPECFVSMSLFGPIYYLVDGDGENRPLRRYISGDRTGADPLDDGVVRSSDEVQRMEAVRAMAEDIAIVDGNVWHKAHGFHLKVYADIERGSRGVTKPHVNIDYHVNRGRRTNKLDRARTGRCQGGYRLGLLELEDLADFAGPRPVHMMTDLEIFDPSAFEFDGLTAFAAPILSHVSDVLKDGAGALAADHVDWWLTVRDEAERLDGDSLATVSESSVGTLRELLVSGLVPDIDNAAILRGLDTYDALRRRTGQPAPLAPAVGCRGSR